MVRPEKEGGSVAVELGEIARCSHEEKLNEGQERSFCMVSRCSKSGFMGMGIPLSGSTL